MLVDMFRLVALINEKYRAIIVHVADTTANNLIYFADGCDFIPVVTHYA